MNFIFIIGAKYVFIFSVLIAGLYWLKQPKSLKKEIVIYGVISIVSIYLIALLSAHFYYDPRPFVVGNFTPLIPHVPDNGFPSDHTLITSAIAAIMYIYNKKIGLLLWSVALFVGISRVYVGVHHLVDIIASMIISIIVSYILYLIIYKMNSVTILLKRWTEK
jgi:undecaprenyl-diphosphatase